MPGKGRMSGGMSGGARAGCGRKRTKEGPTRTEKKSMKQALKAAAGYQRAAGQFTAPDDNTSVEEQRAAIEARAAGAAAMQGRAYVPSYKPPLARMVAAACSALDKDSTPVQQVAAPVAVVCEGKKTTLLNFFKAA